MTMAAITTMVTTIRGSTIKDGTTVAEMDHDWPPCSIAKSAMESNSASVGCSGFVNVSA